MLLNFEHLKTFYSALQQKIKSFRGNWEQNDPTADDYIKNRPFYAESNEILIIEALTRDEYENYPTPSCNFIPGKKYIVIWNEKRYDVICQNDGSYNMLGGDENNYPFYIDDGGGDSLFIGAEGDFTVSIYQDETVIHKLDNKFIDLPENLVTTDKLEEMLPENLVTSDNITEVLPDNLITSEELEEALPENLVTSDELATVATSGDYKDLSNAPTNVICCDSDLSFGRLFNRQDGWAPSSYSYASCQAFDEVLIDVKNNGTYKGSAVTDDGLNWKFRVYYSDQHPYGYLQSGFNEMDSGIIDVNSGSHCIGVGGQYIGYYKPETGWKIEKFPITQNNSYLGWNHICFGDNKAVVICGPMHKYTDTEQVSSVAAYCTNYNKSTDTYTWIETTMPEAAQWSKVAFKQSGSVGTFVAIAYGTTAAYSNNGRDWTKTELPVDATWTWLAWNSHSYRFVAVSLEGDAAYSDDGITWTLIEGEIKPYAGPIVFYDSKLVSLSSDKTERYPRYSSNGITWSEGTTPLPFAYNNSIVLLQKVFNNCLMAIDSSGQYVVSNDGIIWNNTVLMTDKVLENENLANTLAPYISAVSYEAQTLTEEQKAQARANIGITIYNGEYEAVT